MKTGMIAVFVASFVLSPAHAQGSISAPLSQTKVCLQTYLIDHTDVPDNNTIIFHMRDGKTWTNKLIGTCSGLRFHGFSYIVRGNDEICSNLQSIRVLETGSVCLLGEFVPAPANAPAPASQPGG